MWLKGHFICEAKVSTKLCQTLFLSSTVVTEAVELPKIQFLGIWQALFFSPPTGHHVGSEIASRRKALGAGRRPGWGFLVGAHRFPQTPN